MSSQIELLQAMPIFGAISDEALRFLLDRSRPFTSSEGSYYCREHEEASSLFVLESGLASVLRDWHGREVLLRKLQPGDCFGEMALLDPSPRSASVRADLTCVAIELSSADLLALFERDAEQFALIQMNIGREVCRRLRQCDALMFRQRMQNEGKC